MNVGIQAVSLFFFFLLHFCVNFHLILTVKKRKKKLIFHIKYILKACRVIHLESIQLNCCNMQKKIQVTVLHPKYKCCISSHGMNSRFLVITNIYFKNMPHSYAQLIKLQKRFFIKTIVGFLFVCLFFLWYPYLQKVLAAEGKNLQNLN